MVKAVNEVGLEVCCTLGMLSESQAERLKDAGLYAYNHNIDSSEEFYTEIISTRTYQDRLETLSNVRSAGLSVCCGGIIGMGETDTQRIDMLHTLSTLPEHQESVPVNALVPVKGTPMENQERVSAWDMLRMISTARIIMPKAMVRLSAGRTEMNEEQQALCFLAGANSIFAGDKLLTTPNPAFDDDLKMLENLGLCPRPQRHTAGREAYRPGAMSESLSSSISKKLRDRSDLGLLCKLRVVHSYIDFNSNDYLGLARDPRLSAAIQRSVVSNAADFGSGSTGYRLISGNSDTVESLAACRT